MIDVVQIALASLMNAAMISIFTLLAGLSRGRRIVAATLGLFMSVLSSLVATGLIAAAGV
jgi:hypothetical protein